MKKNGISIKQVKHSPRDAINLLEHMLKQNGIQVYARIDQQAEALKANIKTGAIEFLLFGNPAKGGLVIQQNPVAALDLPLKVIAWQDERKVNFIAFNSIDYLRARHSLSSLLAQQIDIEKLLSKIFQ